MIKSKDTINLNNEFYTSDSFEMGLTESVKVKCGRKYYYMDVVKNAINTHVEKYECVNNCRNSFSKYDPRANLQILVFNTNNCHIDRDLFENFERLRDAVYILEHTPHGREIKLY